MLEDAVKQGTLSRNVAKMVERPQQHKKDMKTWTEGQAATFLEAVANDRLSAAWQLSLYGLRRGEVLGLRWSDMNLDAKTITIRKARVEVTGVGVVEGEPKTERGKRTLPLDDALASALRSLKAGQARDRLGPGGLTQPAVLTVAESILWWTNWATPTARSGSPMSSGGWPRQQDCR